MSKIFKVVVEGDDNADWIKLADAKATKDDREASKQVAEDAKKKEQS